MGSSASRNKKIDVTLSAGDSTRPVRSVTPLSPAKEILNDLSILNSSDPITESVNNEKEKVSASEDFEELQDLEHTFESIDILESSTKRLPDVETLTFPDMPHKDKVNKNLQQVVTNPLIPICGADTLRSSFGPHKYSDLLDVPPIENENTNLSVKSAPIKLVSDEMYTSQLQQEDWVYEKKETNDFDPEKFRQVNRKVKEDYNKQAVTQDDISYLPDLRKGTMPSLVSPTPMLDYNISEENILNSIEEEYALNKNSFLNLSQK